MGYTISYCIILGLIGSDWVFAGFYWVLLGFTGFYWVILGYTGLYWVLLGFTGLYWVLLGYTGLYWVLLGFTVFFWDFTEDLGLGAAAADAGTVVVVVSGERWLVVGVCEPSANGKFVTLSAIPVCVISKTVMKGFHFQIYQESDCVLG